eukprot:685539-Pleurochrysis_carterae.AAC.1
MRARAWAVAPFGSAWWRERNLRMTRPRWDLACRMLPYRSCLVSCGVTCAGDREEMEWRVRTQLLPWLTRRRLVWSWQLFSMPAVLLLLCAAAAARA